MIPTVCTGPVIVLVFWVTRGSGGGLYVMKRVSNANPLSVLAGALAVYLGQVIFLGLVIFSLSGADWLDGKAFGLSVLGVALVWQLFQVLAFMRLRKPVYDEPADEAADAPSAQEQVS